MTCHVASSDCRLCKVGIDENTFPTLGLAIREYEVQKLQKTLNVWYKPIDDGSNSWICYDCYCTSHALLPMPVNVKHDTVRYTDVFICILLTVTISVFGYCLGNFFAIPR